MKNAKLTLTLLALSAALSACSGSSGGGGGSNGLGGGNEKPASVDGPVLDGVYSSDCVKNVWGENRKMRLELSGGSFYLKDTTFEDSTCHQVRKKEEMRGTYNYMSKVADDNFLIRYTIPIDSNSWYNRYQNVRIGADALVVSEMNPHEEEVGGATPIITLKKIGATPPPGQNSGNIELEQGDYNVSEGFSYKSVNVGIGKTDGKLSMIVVSFYGTSIAMGMVCEKNICKDPRWADYEAEILDTKTFRFSKADTSDLAIYRKR